MKEKKSTQNTNEKIVRTPWGYVVLEDALTEMKQEIKDLSDKLDKNLSNLENVQNKQAKKTVKIDKESVKKLQSQINELLTFKKELEGEKLENDLNQKDNISISENKTVKIIEKEINELKGVTGKLSKNLEKINLRVEKMQRVVRMIAERLEAQ